MVLRPIDINHGPLDPRPDLHPVALSEALPLALLPLRLEYRFVTASRPVHVIDRTELTAELARIGRPAPTTGSPRLDPRIIRERRQLMTNIARVAPVRNLPLPAATEQLWVRWYPDENFASTGIASPTATEIAALAAFNAALGATPWWRANETVVAATAWQTFVGVVGAVRAVHLKRTEHLSATVDPATRVGRIAGLPAVVHLFAYADDKATLIGTGRSIPKNTEVPSAVRYAPDALQADGWLVNFTQALELGMGLKITDNAMIETAKRADWLFAVGLSEAAGPAEIADLVADRVASGGFAILPQDTPTNATAAGATAYAKARTMPLDYLVEATDDERGRHDTSKTTAAELLAEAFGIDETILRRAVAGADQGFEDARAMLRVVGPVLLDGLLDGKTFSFTQLFDNAGPEVDENAFVSILAAVISARGVLPALRFGHTAYGVLPMTKVADLDFAADEDFSADERQVLGTLAFVAKQARSVLPAYARGIVPVLQPDDPSASDKLEAILKINPVSKRISVIDDDIVDGRAKGIGCPYVQAAQPQANQSAAAYLDALARSTLTILPDPTEDDRGWPLLYRLARFALARNLSDVVRVEVGLAKGQAVDVRRLPTASRARASSVLGTLQGRSARALAAGPMAGLSTKAQLRLRSAATDFVASLDHLAGIAKENGGIAKLEMLLFETIDLFQHRLDALSVGLAYARMARARKKGRTGLALGYYGLLGKLRPTSATGGGDGYIQAPSQAQALTAAVLRSAYRRHRAEGAFAINLTGPRVRRALRLLDLLSKGHSLGEGLGMLGERWLHDRRQDALIYPLRQQFAIADERNIATAGRRMFDGEAFARSTQAETGVRAELRTALHGELDTIVDLVMAEAVHLRAQGLAPAANAWLQVLSGGPIPGSPTFIRTQRSGHGSTHRVAMAIPMIEPSSTDSLRERLEPGLAALASTLLANFNTAAIELRVARPRPGATAQAIRLELARDLGMRPIDLVVGGLADVERRARTMVIDLLLADPTLLSAIAADGMPESFANGQASFVADLSVGSTPVEALATKAESLRVVVARARPLDATDLNAAAPAREGLLDEAGETATLEFGIAALKRRAEFALALVTTLSAAVPSQLTAYLAAVLELARRISAAESDAAIATQRGLAETRRRALSASLRALATFGLPEALEPVVLDEDVADSAETDRQVTAILARLETKRAALAAASAVLATGHATAREARADLTALITALQGLADGPGMPILPPIPRSTPALRPTFDAAVQPSAALASWAGVRERIAAVATLADLWPAARVCAVKPEATAEDPTRTPVETHDPQEESVSPRSWHFGQYLGEPALLAATTPLAGIVIDEWAEQRPSAVQSAAIAINYDSPQSEPPSAILLAVPPKPAQTTWTPQLAAETIGEAVAWMQARAIPADQRITGWTMMPRANQVPLKSGQPAKRRIPAQTLNLSFTHANLAIAEFAVLPTSDGAAAGADAAGIVERGFNTKLKE